MERSRCRCKPINISRLRRSLLLLRHPDFNPVLFQFRDKNFSDCRIFISVFDQVAAFPRARLAQTMRASATTQRAHEPFAVTAPGWRDVPCWIGAGVEVLMKPAIGRYKQTTFHPIDALLRRCRRI